MVDPTDGIVLLGIATGLQKDLLVPSFFGALLSLRRSEEAALLNKCITVAASTVCGMLGGLPLASTLGVFIPSAADVPVGAAKYLVAGLIAYGGLAIVDRWLFPSKKGDTK